MKGAYYVGIALIIMGIALYFVRETKLVSDMPKLFTEHAVAVSLILSGMVVIATQLSQYAELVIPKSSG